MDFGAVFSMALGWVWEAFRSIFLAAWAFIKDMFTWVFEQILDLVLLVVIAVDTSGISDHLLWFQQIPEGVATVMAASGVASALAIIVSALGVRLVLQLIPFVRLGS